MGQANAVGPTSIEGSFSMLAYRMAPIPMTLSYVVGHFCCLNLSNSHTSRHIGLD